MTGIWRPGWVTTKPGRTIGTLSAHGVERTLMKTDRRAGTGGRVRMATSSKQLGLGTEESEIVSWIGGDVRTTRRERADEGHSSKVKLSVGVSEAKGTEMGFRGFE